MERRRFFRAAALLDRGRYRNLAEFVTDGVHRLDEVLGKHTSPSSPAVGTAFFAPSGSSTIS